MMTRTGLPLIAGRTTAFAAAVALVAVLSPAQAASDGTAKVAAGVTTSNATATDFSAARRHRHHGHGGAAAAAAFAGIVGTIGAIAAAQASRDAYYYDSPYAYGGGPYYSAPYHGGSYYYGRSYYGGPYGYGTRRYDGGGNPIP